MLAIRLVSIVNTLNIDVPPESFNLHNFLHDSIPLMRKKLENILERMAVKFWPAVKIRIVKDELKMSRWFKSKPQILLQPVDESQNDEMDAIDHAIHLSVAEIDESFCQYQENGFG